MTAGAAGSNAADGRVLGHLRGTQGGPLLLVIAGIHGNEPAGIAAARRVLARLREEHVPMHGELLVLLGNRGALQQQRRFLTRDLNRGWTEESLAHLRSATGSHGNGNGSPAGAAPETEDREQLDLLAAIEPFLHDGRRVFVLDLHTSSAAGFAFSIVAGTADSSGFALAVGLPALRGMLERVHGILAGYLTRRGCVSLVVEGGQNDDPGSVDQLHSVLMLALAFTGLVEGTALPDLAQHAARLQGASRGLPRVIQVHHRHALRKDDDFRMEPGFANLQRVRAGTLLARDRHGEVRADEDGWLVFPLYQSQGDDGFFLGREMES